MAYDTTNLSSLDSAAFDSLDSLYSCVDCGKDEVQYNIIDYSKNGKSFCLCSECLVKNYKYDIANKSLVQNDMIKSAEKTGNFISTDFLLRINPSCIACGSPNKPFSFTKFKDANKKDNKDYFICPDCLETFKKMNLIKTQSQSQQPSSSTSSNSNITITPKATDLNPSIPAPTEPSSPIPQSALTNTQANNSSCRNDNSSSKPNSNTTNVSTSPQPPEEYTIAEPVEVTNTKNDGFLSALAQFLFAILFLILSLDSNFKNLFQSSSEKPS